MCVHGRIDDESAGYSPYAIRYLNVVSVQMRVRTRKNSDEPTLATKKYRKRDGIIVDLGKWADLVSQARRMKLASLSALINLRFD